MSAVLGFRRPSSGPRRELGSCSEGAFDDCQVNAPGPVLLIALLGLAACVASGLASWRSLRGSANESRRVIAIMSAGLAALFTFAILLAIVANLVLPPCFQ